MLMEALSHIRTCAILWRATVTAACPARRMLNATKDADKNSGVRPGQVRQMGAFMEPFRQGHVSCPSASCLNFRH